MCGIIGYVGPADTTERLLTGLDNLEYRGYDSAGVALNGESDLEVLKQEGEVSQLEAKAQRAGPTGTFGIGHTRWSTHGVPSDANAHPHTDCTGSIAVVHNGIIDNYTDLRARLEGLGHTFTSDTDTEVIPHLIEDELTGETTPEEAFRRAVDELSGSYAIAMVLADGDVLYATRSGSPLVLGVADDEFYLASDVPAFLEFTDDVVYLEDGDVVVAKEDGYRLTGPGGAPIERPVETVDWTPEDAEKGGYDHYMMKEIHEQPTAIERAIKGRVLTDGGGRTSGETPGDGTTTDQATVDRTTVAEELTSAVTEDVRAVQFVACGTSYHAALYGQQLLANQGITAHTTLASEFVANPPPLPEGTLVVGVTQSGETADTLEALRAAQAAEHRTLAVTNVVGSTAARECDDTLFIRAGPEIGVAATKTFSSQVAVLALLADYLSDADDIGGDLERIPDQVQEIVDSDTALDIARRYHDADSYFFIGRGVARPVALEGALKLKEISYEHAEGFPAGELKHGPLALVTPETPVFAVITGENEERMRGTIKEISARGAPVIAVTDREIDGVDHQIPIPATRPELAGILANVQLQLFAYHTATMLDRPVDKPRNLAKSVTVE